MKKIRKIIEGFSSIRGEKCTICGTPHTNTHMPYCSNICASEAMKRIPRSNESETRFNTNTDNYVREIFGVIEINADVPCSHCGRYTRFIHSSTGKVICRPECLKSITNQTKDIITDPYLHSFMSIERLINEYDKYGRIIVAFDYDSTVHDYHNMGHSYDKLKDILKKAKALGCYLIVYTCSNEDRYPEIKQYLEENGIVYDSINENHPDTDFSKNKLYYNIMLDDRAGLASAYADLDVVLDAILTKKKQENEENIKKIQDLWIGGIK